MPTPKPPPAAAAPEAPKASERCPECDGAGVVPDSLDNYVYDPYGMAPCPTCRKRKAEEPQR